MKHAEDDWGLRLYIGDRDDVGGVSKMHNFVRGFESSDKVIVCLTRVFIDDGDCMNYLATALDSSKPLFKYIFVLFDDIQTYFLSPSSAVAAATRLPLYYAHVGQPEDEDERDAFWRRLREALMHDPRPGQMSTSLRCDTFVGFVS